MSSQYNRKIIGMLKNYRSIALRVKEVIRRFDPKARVFVFGSTVRGNFTAASDIDMLVITEKIDRKYDMIVEVYKTIEAPVELHIITKKQFSWYKKFIEPEELLEI